MGTSKSYILEGGLGALSFKTLAGPPERIIALGLNFFKNSSLTLLNGCISQ